MNYSGTVAASEVQTHFEPERTLPPDILDEITEIRVNRPQIIAEESRKRKRRARLTRDGKLVLDAPRSERIVRQIEGRGFADEADVGGWVSVHWGWACEVLSQTQKARLERYTRHHLAIANQTV